jgi:hypothetical protein
MGRDWIDYWQPTSATRRGLKNRFGIRVRNDCCWALVQIGEDEASTFGKPHKIPVDVENLPMYVRLILDEHRANSPNSDLLDVLTGKISFQDALYPLKKFEAKRMMTTGAMRLPNAS